MGDVIQMAPFVQDCCNCRWHVKNGCRVPGGWKCDKQLRCLSFRWSLEAIAAQRKELGKE